MLSKDEALKRFFQAIAGRTATARGACQIRQGETLFSVCGACVLMAPCPRQYSSQQEGVPYKLAQMSLPVLKPSNPNDVFPENVFASWCLEIPAKDVSAFRAPAMHVLTMCSNYGCFGSPCIMSVVPDSDGTQKVLTSIPTTNCTGDPEDAARLGITFFVMPDELYSLELDTGLSLDAFKAAFMVNKRKPLPVLCLTGENSLLYTTLQQISKPYAKAPVIVKGNERITLNAWDQATWSYVEVMKGGKIMPKYPALKSPVAPKVPKAQPKAAPVAAPEEPKEAPVVDVDVVKPKVDERSIQAYAEELKAQESAEPQEAVEDIEEREAVEEPVAVATDEVQEQRIKRTRTKRTANTAFDVDLTAMIEYLSSPVNELPVESMDAAMEEIRQIRDLQIAAARRSANLMIAMHKVCRPSVDALEDIKKALSGKVNV